MRRLRLLSNPSLQRLQEALSEKQAGSGTNKWKSTRDLVMETGIMAVSTTISELRARGVKVEMHRAETAEGRRFYYRIAGRSLPRAASITQTP